MTSSSDIKRRFPRGTKLNVSFLRKTSFGVFVKIPDIEVLGLIEYRGIKIPDKYLEHDAIFEAIVIDFRDSPAPFRRQIRLSIDPVLVANPSLIKAN